MDIGEPEEVKRGNKSKTSRDLYLYQIEVILKYLKNILFRLVDSN